VALFLQKIGVMIGRRGTIVLLGVLALCGCGGEEPPRLTDAGPPLAGREPPARWSWRPGDRGARLMAKGRQSFEGRSDSRCVVHDETGLQINLRTGDPDLPAVAVRIEDFQGKGPYQGRLFVTGRNRTGALVSSTGEVSLEVQQTAATAGAGGSVLLGGWFEGHYDGPAGTGSVQGRFGSCPFLPPRAVVGSQGSPQAVGP
jgi:hypothetical protein